ncbi:MAG: LppU/SCO3897 family protein [Micromonosporaceae bacterium]
MIAVITALLLVVALAGGALYLLVGSSGDSYAVGSCIKEVAGAGQPASCDEKGAYKIVKRVKDADKCPDPKAPKATVDDSDVILCLRKAK